MAEKFFDKHKSKLYTLLVIATALTIGVYFWRVVRSNIVLTSCSEIAVDTTHLQSRTNLFIDTNDSFELNLNDCLSQAGLDR